MVRNFSIISFCLVCVFSEGAFAAEHNVKIKESEVSKAIDLVELQKQLQSTGLVGYVHGADGNSGLFVFTWRDENDFFQFMHFPMVTKDPEILKSLRGLSRHDKVQIIGDFIDHEAPLKHIALKTLNILKRGTQGYDPGAAIPFPYELYTKTEMTALVHIVAEGGKVLVIDYKDAIIPVLVTEPSLTKDLYRNDKIHLKFKIRSQPSRPSHLELDTAANEPLKVVERLVDSHGKITTLQGSLVMFPKSEQVAFNVFALQIEDPMGIKINYTLVNFESSETFAAIRKKLDDLWETHKSTAIYGRNKFVNPKIKLQATGTINVVDAGQANPQIILESPQSIEAFKLVCDWQKL